MDATATAIGLGAGLEVIATPPSAATLRTPIGVYLEDYGVRQFRTLAAERDSLDHWVTAGDISEAWPNSVSTASLLSNRPLSDTRATVSRPTRAIWVVWTIRPTFPAGPARERHECHPA